MRRSLKKPQGIALPGVSWCLHAILLLNFLVTTYHPVLRQMSIGCYMGKISEKIVGWTGQEEKQYNGLAVYPILNSRRGDIMVSIFDFLAAVAASVAGYYICKWIDHSRKDS